MHALIGYIAFFPNTKTNKEHFIFAFIFISTSPPFLKELLNYSFDNFFNSSQTYGYYVFLYDYYQKYYMYYV